MLHNLDSAAYVNRFPMRHPSEKLIFSAGMLMLALLLPPWPCACVLIGMMLFATLIIARVSIRAYLTMLAAPLAFLLVSGFTLSLSLTFQQGAFQIAWAPDGGHEAMLVSLRALAALTALLFITATIPIPEVLMTLYRWQIPAVIIELALLIYRFLFAFAETLDSMYVAQTTRLGYDTWRSTYRSSAILAATLLQRVFDRAHRMEDGLAARGWEGELRVLSRKTSFSLSMCVIIVAAQIMVGGMLYYWASYVN